MEFLIGRSLANNVTNLLLDPFVKEIAARDHLDRLALLEQEPDAGLGNGGLGRLAACFLDSMATMQLPAMGYGLRYEYGMFRQSIQDGWQREEPDNWLRRQDPWEVPRPDEAVEVKLNCSFALQDGHLHLVAGRPSSLIGIPFDACVSGRSISWSPAPWPISSAASAAATPIGAPFPTRSRSSSTIRIRRWRCRS